MKAVAIFNFEARNKFELSFKVGDIIEVQNFFYRKFKKFS